MLIIISRNNKTSRKILGFINFLKTKQKMDLQKMKLETSNMIYTGPREMAQQLRTPTALAENPVSVPSTHRAAPLLASTVLCMWHKYMQTAYKDKNKYIRPMLMSSLTTN